MRPRGTAAKLALVLGGATLLVASGCAKPHAPRPEAAPVRSESAGPASSPVDPPPPAATRVTSDPPSPASRPADPPPPSAAADKKGETPMEDVWEARRRSIPRRMIYVATKEGLTIGYIYRDTTVADVWKHVRVPSRRLPGAGAISSRTIVNLSQLHREREVREVEPPVAFLPDGHGRMTPGYFEPMAKIFFQWRGASRPVEEGTDGAPLLSKKQPISVVEIDPP